MTAKLYIGVFMLLAGTLYSCQKDEEVNKLDADYRVMTDYDPETDFSQFRSYYLADSILFIGQHAGTGLQSCSKQGEGRLGITPVPTILWDTPLHLIGGGDFPVIGVLFIGRTEFGGRNRLVGGKFQKRTPIHNEIQRAA